MELENELLERYNETIPFERKGNFPLKLFALRSTTVINFGFVNVVPSSPWI